MARQTIARLDRWVTFLKQFARLSMSVHSCPVLYSLSLCLSDCNVGVLSNGWMDQDETWHGGRPRSRPHCVRWGPGPSFTIPQKGGHSSAPVDKKDVGVGPGHIALHGNPAPNFWPISVVAKWLDGSIKMPLGC